MNASLSLGRVRRSAFGVGLWFALSLVAERGLGAESDVFACAETLSVWEKVKERWSPRDCALYARGYGALWERPELAKTIAVSLGERAKKRDVSRDRADLLLAAASARLGDYAAAEPLFRSQGGRLQGAPEPLLILAARTAFLLGELTVAESRYRQALLRVENLETRGVLELELAVVLSMGSEAARRESAALALEAEQFGHPELADWAAALSFLLKGSEASPSAASPSIDAGNEGSAGRIAVALAERRQRKGLELRIRPAPEIPTILLELLAECLATTSRPSASEFLGRGAPKVFEARIVELLAAEPGGVP